MRTEMLMVPFVRSCSPQEACGYPVMGGASSKYLRGSGRLTGAHLPSSQAVDIGVIGYGYWGPNLVCNFANTEGAQVVSVSDLDPEKLALVGRRHTAVSATTEFRDFLKDSRIVNLRPQSWRRIRSVPLASVGEHR